MADTNGVACGGQARERYVRCFIAWSNANAETIGWFAYAPMSNEIFSGNGLVSEP